MTRGSVGRVLLMYSLPVMLSAVFQQLYNISDSIIAGNFAGKAALAAIGASYPVTMIFIAIAQGFSTGSTVVISKLLGEKDVKGMKTAIWTSIIFSAALALVLTVAGLVFCRPIIAAMQTTQDIFDDSALFLSIFCMGLFFLFLYNSCNGAFLALGDSKTPLVFLIISSVGNILLDLLFVAVWNMGVAGAAWATFICQALCSILAFSVLLKRISKIKTDGHYDKFTWDALQRICRIAVPSILQMSFVSVGNLFVQSIINSFGVDAVAGYSAAIKLNTFVLTTFTTAGTSISNFTAQNFGAGLPQRIRKGYKLGIIITESVAIPVTAIFLIFGGSLVGLFMDTSVADNNGALNIGIGFLNIIAPFYFVIATKLVADGILRGVGAMKAFMVSTFSDLILRVILSFVLAMPLGLNGVWMSWPVGWIVAAVISRIYYCRTMRSLVLMQEMDLEKEEISG